MHGRHKGESAEKNNTTFCLFLSECYLSAHNLALKQPLKQSKELPKNSNLC
jgi:hypothetical protein